MHVAIVDEELPYPLNSGKRIRTFQLVSRLAERHRITCIYHRNADLADLAGRVIVIAGIWLYLNQPARSIGNPT